MLDDIRTRPSTFLSFFSFVCWKLVVFFRFFRLPFVVSLSRPLRGCRRIADGKSDGTICPVLRRAETCDVEEEAPLNLLKSSKLSLNLV